MIAFIVEIYLLQIIMWMYMYWNCTYCIVALINILHNYPKKIILLLLYTTCTLLPKGWRGKQLLFTPIIYGYVRQKSQFNIWFNYW